MMPLEIKGAVAGGLTSVFILAATFTAGGFYRTHVEREMQAGKASPAAENATARGRSFFFQSCAHCHGQEADGGKTPPVF
jgi:mono/diheme cytochrome c family protein